MKPPVEGILAISIKLTPQFSDPRTLIIYLIDILDHMEKDVQIKIYTDYKDLIIHLWEQVSKL